MPFTKTCETCGVEFSAKKRAMRFCSKGCIRWGAKPKLTIEMLDAIDLELPRGEYRDAELGRRLGCPTGAIGYNRRLMGYEYARGKSTGSNCERLMEMLDRREDGCWVFTGGKNPGGYGSFKLIGDKHVVAHRVAYTELVGPIPDGMCVCHKCDNPPCCNPDHLFIGTHKDNADDKVSKGRHVFGSKHPSAKLTEQQALDIIRRYKTETGASLATEYGVRILTISRIVNGKNWKHLSA